MAHKFDTKVQYIKYKVLREVARLAWEDRLAFDITEIPKTIIPGKEATMRCCVYKERAIIADRVKLAMGGDRGIHNIIEVLDIACDECPLGGYEVTSACRGCLAQRCADVCPRGAISFGANHVAHIDKSKCVECGMCAKVCPYSAIFNYQRPCERACKADAITMDEAKKAKIDNDKCVACGACVYQCPWGAITDKAFILNAIDIIRHSEGGKKYHVYAVVAPTIAGQFTYAKLGQVVSGIKKLGFHAVVEAAFGADMTAFAEAKELTQKGRLLSSCCPAFTAYVQKQFPTLSGQISQTPSPMAMISAYIKNQEPTARVIFVGPCTAKKLEAKNPGVAPFVDCVLTFEELQALLDSRELDLNALDEEALDNASYFGRIFARSGGLCDAVAQALTENGNDFGLKALPCDGLEECRIALIKLNKNKLPENFIEGMACTGGCIGGAGCLTHGPKSKLEVDKYGRSALEKTISDALKQTGEAHLH